ncbi:MAG: hypothetical protein IIY87_05165 [Bacteroidales bacterium]|jgi:hypothetical protein|nr:hypothetical protein [Bacteroidales bacterium]
MKKALFTGFLGIAFAFAMVACNGTAQNNDSVADDTTCAQAEEQECMHHCQMTCPDSVCLAANCENCTCPEDSPCHKKACMGDGSCQKDAACAEKHECKHEGEGCCKKQGEGCKKDCGNHNN